MYLPQCPHWHPYVQGPGTAVPVVTVPQRVDHVMVLWTVRMALMRRAVGPFMQALPAGMAWPWAGHRWKGEWGSPFSPSQTMTVEES